VAAQVEANKAILRRILAAYAQGDFDPVFAVLDENIEWSSHSLAGHYRFGGRRTGRAGVLEALAMIATDFSIDRYDVREMIGEGNVVWVTSQLHVTERNSGKPLVFPLVGRWEFREGKIISCSEFFDTAAVLHQQGRLPKDLAKALKA